MNKGARGVLTFCFVLSSFPLSTASAHRADLITAGGRVGPIVLDETRYPAVKKWFGPPTAVQKVRIGCIRLKRARWEGSLTMIVGRRSVDRIIPQVTVHQRTVESSKHGSITFHTKKGLEVGDTEARLQELYPKAEGELEVTHTHYLLRYGLYGRLVARVELGQVVSLLSGPREFC